MVADKGNALTGIVAVMHGGNVPQNHGQFLSVGHIMFTLLSVYHGGGRGRRPRPLLAAARAAAVFEN